ncbi:Scr1 family TA system antitoxin-like transcriptional regulator [Streptomyces sp. NPDC050997]|uniref:Scr1 family TA system antitoxin-like transcriptional regulator n=1 Tax=Streptomyces sp. NPDC050997 TaxID=3155519 RepID=UPI0034312A52
MHFAEWCDRFFNTSGYFARLLVRVGERGHPGWFVPYINLEKQASRVEDYSNALIMLQTWEYAEATFRATHPREADDQIKARIEARLARREVMEAMTVRLPTSVRSVGLRYGGGHRAHGV